MIRIVTIAACAVFMTGCTALPEWAVSSHFFSRHADPDVGHYSFDWTLSGEHQVAPFQVFDNGKQTWLQFLPGQVVPAIFERTASGERPVAYTRHGDYLILDGVRPELLFRGGRLRAWAQKIVINDASGDADAEPVALSMPVSLQDMSATDLVRQDDVGAVGDKDADTDQHQAGDRNASVRISADEDGYASSRISAAQRMRAETQIHARDDGDSGAGIDARTEGVNDAIVSTDAALLTRASFESVNAPARPDFYIGVHDPNLREALHRWAAQAGWTFAPEHWDVDVDIAISGEAGFHGSFQDAVQDVLSSTELAERPLRPCFYSNQVLRVVSYTQSCDRSGAAAS